MQLSVQLYIDIGKIIPHLQGNLYRQKNKTINSLIFISAIIKQIKLMIFWFWFLGLTLLRKKRKELVIY